MIFRQHQFGPWAALAVLLGVLVDVSSGMMSIQLIPQDPVIGRSVTLSVTGITGRIRSFIWYKGPMANKDYQILTYYPGDESPIIPGPLFHSRMTPFPNGSLQISNLNRTDEGNYTVRIQTDKPNDTTVNLKIYVLLGVLVDVSSGMISIQLLPQDPVIKGSVTLSVTEITGGIRYFIWYKGLDTNNIYTFLTYIPGDKSPLAPGPLFHSRLTPFPNGSLQISNLNRTDEGNYTVKIQADQQSDITVSLKIYDIVTKPTITASTSLPKENDAVTLTCDSTDAERILWSRIPSGATLSSDNRTVSLCRINCMDLGDYRCKAENRVSERFSDPYTLTISSPTVCQTTSPSGNGLDGGKVAGIVIGAVIGIFILEVIVYFALKKKKNKPSGSVYENVNVSQQRDNEKTLPGSGVSSTQESNYEQLSHKDRSVYSTIESAT